MADTEKLWIENRRLMVNKVFGLNWDFETTNHHLGGMSDKTKRMNLDKIGLKTDDKFWVDSLAMDMKIMAEGFPPTEGVEEILQNKNILHCIATGGILSKSIEKLKTIGFWNKYISQKNLFTADMVEHGKPEPELFRLAAKNMGVEPKDCVVIEDSLAGMTAGLRAGMCVVAFVGCEMNKSPQYIEKIKNLGVKHIFENMQQFKEFLGFI